MPKKKKSVKRKVKGTLLKRHTIISIFTAVITVVIGIIVIKAQIPEQPICANSESCIKNLSGAYDPTATTGVFMGKQVVPPAYIATAQQKQNVLGDSDGSEKHIYVDLSAQHLYAYDGQTLTYSFPVSTGKWNHTPTGDFKIWIKLKYTRMSGGSQTLGTYYNLPNVPWTMFYYNEKVSKAQGYSLHGAYWHNNFGHPMSHGCVNILPENAEKLFSWAQPTTGSGNVTYPTEEDPGTMVTVYGVTPRE